ncbi:unnamed protein product [Prunus armeniaca]
MEPLYVAWERFKDLLRKCPYHKLPTWIQTFYNRLSQTSRTLVDAAAGGSGEPTEVQGSAVALSFVRKSCGESGVCTSVDPKPFKYCPFFEKFMDSPLAGGALMAKTATEAFELLETMASNSYQWLSERMNLKPAEVLEVNVMGPHASSECTTGNPFVFAE